MKVNSKVYGAYFAANYVATKSQDTMNKKLAFVACQTTNDQ